MACVTKRRGRYVIDCYDQHGNRYRKTMPEGTTKEEARKELREIEAKIERRTFLHEKKTPLFSEVKAQWLEHKRQYLRETTWEVASTHCRHHFTNLDGMRINQITTAVIERYIADLQNTDRLHWRRRQKDEEPGVKSTTTPGKKIALGTVRKTIVILNQIMAYAVRHRLIDFNPVRDAERPRRQGKEGEEKSISILTPEQIQAFIEAVEEQKYRTLFLVAIMTGARQGEVLGLKWADVDFQKKQIAINRTFNTGRFFTPKTKGSIRRIDLAPMVMKELAAWRLKSGGKDEDLVFSNETGGPMNYSNMVQRHFFKALKKSGLQRIRFHDLRHSYASLLLAQGENIKYVQTQLGHSSPTVTLNIYAHLMRDSNQEAACRLEDAIFRTGHKMVTDEKKGLTTNG